MVSLNIFFQRLVSSHLKVQNGTVHWDTKYFNDITGNEKVDRLPVVISQNVGSQLLGVPRIINGSGIAMATAVYELLVEWNALEDLTTMCFDTTSTNTGHLNGACVLLEQMLGRSLLALACRHHILRLCLQRFSN